MSKGLIRTATLPDPLPTNWIATAAANVYLCAPMPATLPPGAVVVLEYEEDGTVVRADLDAYLQIRPLGNAADGRAVAGLRFHHFMGDWHPKLGNPASVDPVERLYPDGNRPLAIEVRHKLFTGNANPAWDGWGWRAEIVGGAAARSPAARAIGIYADAECTAYLYTTGAFTQQASAWQTDSSGAPLTVWATEYNPGLLGYDNDAKQDVHHACLLGSSKEGFATLRSDQASAYHEFWEHPQGYVPGPSGSWTDSGAVVAQLVGAGIYRVSAVVSGLSIGQPIRLGDSGAGETVFNGYWPTAATPSDYIKIAPHVTAANGARLWVWQ